MDTKNNRPHSRDKEVSNQTVSVGKTGKVSSGPVGNGGRPSSHSSSASHSSSSTRPGSTSSSNTSGTKRAPKRSMGLIAIIAILLLGGGGGLGSLFGGGSSSSSSSGGGLTDLLGGGASIIGDLLGDSSGSDSGPAIQAQPSTSTNTTSSNASTTVAKEARKKYVTPLGKGKDEYTIMIYMCGTDLESNYAMATKDLQEMIKATHSDKVNIIVETGGCKKWKNNIVSNSTNQIYQVVDGGLQLVKDKLGNESMTSTSNLTNFIKFCAQNYPANRNALIFWDHGGGSITGYGYDELHKSSGSMDLAGINAALKKADMKFDWIGFDACLMATLETALVCEQYADYLIASEESEPGTGWYYTNWLTTLAKNTSTGTVEMSEQLIDDFVKTSCASNSREQVTLSVVDLAELSGTIPKAFKNFSIATNDLLSSNDYTVVSNARAGARQFAKSSKINQIDLIDFANRMGTDEAKSLVKALKGCIKYNNSTITNAYGLSIFFPYETLNSMNSAVSTYESIGIDSEYTRCIRSFASMEKAGQITASSSTGSGLGGGLDLGSLFGASESPLPSLLGGLLGDSGSSSGSAGSSIDASSVLNLLSAFSGRSIPAGYEWIDEDAFAGSAEYVSENFINPADIKITWKKELPYLHLSDKQWELMQSVELNIYVDDGEGYIDLGLDNVFEFDGNNLSLDYDRTWLTVNGQVVAYYLVSDTENEDGSWTTIGRIPAELNGEYVNLTVVFDAEHTGGIITGATPLYHDDENVDVMAKGSIEIAEGDEIAFLCDYYDYDGNYSDSYYLGEPITVGAKGLKLTNATLEDVSCSVTYRLTDIYGNHYWTPAWVSEN